LKSVFTGVLKNEVTSSDAKNFILHVITVDIYTFVPHRRNPNDGLLHISVCCTRQPVSSEGVEKDGSLWVKDQDSGLVLKIS
jgi:hypothetical protein